jgi:hypothetical protein
LGLVQGRERDESLEVPQHVRREADRRGVPDAPVNDPVARGDHRRPGRAVLDPLQDGAERVVVRRCGAHGVVGQSVVTRVVGDEVSRR